MDIHKEISALSTAEKILLVEKLWDSINKEELDVSDAQKKELDRRLELHEKGETSYHNWQDVKKNLGGRKK